MLFQPYEHIIIFLSYLWNFLLDKDSDFQLQLKEILGINTFNLLFFRKIDFCYQPTNNTFTQTTIKILKQYTKLLKHKVNVLKNMKKMLRVLLLYQKIIYSIYALNLDFILEIILIKTLQHYTFLLIIVDLQCNSIRKNYKQNNNIHAIFKIVYFLTCVDQSKINQYINMQIFV